MDRIGQCSQANNGENEDFLFTAPFGSVQLLVVGDFAQSEFQRIDAATTHELQLLTKDNSVIEAANKSLPLLLSQLATKLNGRLLGFADKYRAKFQASAIFAAIDGTDLFYLPVGDCRLSVHTGKSLLLLNGSIWVDSSGNTLPMLVESGQDVYKGSEPPPDQALGVLVDIDLSTDRVKHYPLSKSDLVLLYSDGVDKFVSPVHLLKLIHGHPVDATVQTLADKIIDEVRIEHGNDDRTLLILTGPHVNQRDQETAQSIREIQKVSASIAGISQRILDLENNSNTLRASVQQISTQITHLPTVDLLRSASARPDGAGESSLKRVVDILTDIQNRVRFIEGLVDFHEEPQPPNKNKQEEKSANKAPAAPAPEADHNNVRSGPEKSELIKLNLNQPFREGVIEISTGFYELIDESRISDSGRKSGMLYLVPSKWMAPGGLTAAYLYLRIDPDPPKENFIADSVKEWIQARFETAANAVANVPDATLESVRNKHWRLREKRRGIQRLWLTDNRLIEKEKQLAAEAFPRESTSSAERGSRLVAAHPGRKSKEEEYWKYIWISLAGALVIAVFTVLYIFWWSKQETTPTERQQSVGAKADPVTLEYGAEGRTLFAIRRGRPEPLDYRIRFGSERAFRNAFPQYQFNSREELEKTIEEKAAQFVSRSIEEDIVAANQRVFEIEPADVNGQPATGNEKCIRFLARVNQQLPRRVHNELKDLSDLNPGLKCGELKAGDRLLVIGKN